MSKFVTATLLIIFSIVIAVLAPFAGHLDIGFSVLEHTSKDDPMAAIFWGIRVPRVILAFAAGAAFGLGGMVFQTLFRNPLTTPFTLGVSSGAAFGATIALKFGIDIALFGIPSTAIAGLIGALAATSLVYSFSVADVRVGNYTMLLAGVAVSFFFSSMILFLQYMSDFSESFTIMRWLMGSAETVGYATAAQVVPFAVVGLCFVLFYARELDLLQCGEELAASKGVEIRGVKLGLFFVVSVMIGGVVSVTGPIGFVGMMVPHVCRLVLGPGHRSLTVVVFFVAGAFLVVCDTVARTIIAPIEMPVGVVTSLLGGPFFLWLLANAVGKGSGLDE